MKNDPVISEEFLNAFVDDQLDGTEKSQTFDAIEHDEVLKQRVCELRGLKEQMRHAYEHPPGISKPETGQRRLQASYLQAWLPACCCASAELPAGLLIPLQERETALNIRVFFRACSATLRVQSHINSSFM